METTLERINSLARELLKHGIASSSDDAYRQAEAMLRKGHENEGSSQMEERMNILSRETGYKLNSLQKEMNALQDDMARLKKDFSQFGADINAIKSRINSIISQTENAQTEAKATAVENPKKEEGLPVYMQHPHKDFSVEKIFYFGNKK